MYNVTIIVKNKSLLIVQQVPGASLENSQNLVLRKAN